MRGSQNTRSPQDNDSSSQTSRPSSNRPTLQPRPPALSARQNALFSASQPFPVASLASQESPRRMTEGRPTTTEKIKDRDDRSSAPLVSPVGAGVSLEKLREAVKNIHGGNLNPASPTSNSARGSMRKSLMAGAIEQQAMSPTTEAAFSSPLATGAQTASSESTESTESARTVRGMATSTPGQIPMRTPSYPFPYVPSRVSSGLNFPLHQPFTALSPTVSSADVVPRSHARDKYSASSQTTPIGGPSYFGPLGSEMVSNGASAGFNGPNLYDVVLQLNADPTLNAWWNTLTNVLREHYKVDRASLALPADATDIENVPWGQKATFNINGIQTQSSAERSTNRSVSVSSETSKSSSSRRSEAPEENSSMPNTRLNVNRPSIESRHSFAGYEHDQYPTISETARVLESNARPATLRRTTTHNAFPIRRSSLSEVQHSPERPAPVYERLREVHVSESGGLEESLQAEDVCAMTLLTLRSLDREKDALLDSAGVNRVLERGRLVILTRDYTINLERRQSVGGLAETSASFRKVRDEASSESTMSHSGLRVAGQAQSKQRVASQPFAFSKPLSGQFVSERRTGADDLQTYEDYEQFPTSPWSQSPAPSPAIQKEPEVNPFFSTGNLDEESFSPTPTHEDYSRFRQVEAIGVDNASTVIHIPLIHPLLSRTLASGRGDETPSKYGQSNLENNRDQYTRSLDRKAPIAILSVQAPDVPYPQTMIHSLRSLGPHLATSFQTSLQNTTLQERIAGALYRQQQIGRSGSTVPLPTSGLDLGFGFESLLHFDPDDGRSSTVDSIASPSEYSGRSRHSPIGSVVCTPGVDPLVNVTSSRHPGGTTPGQNPGSEPTENYFEARKRTALSRSRSGGPISQSQIAGQRAPSADHRTVLRKVETDLSTAAKEQHGTPGRRAESKKAKVKDEKSSPAEASPLRRNQNVKHDGDESRHTVLHSYGADFSASFQSLPVAAVPRTPGAGHHARSSSLSDVFDMPPPSERLLRTIIDSLPVQIFTAAPSTGRVTWVNSKFLVYRGQTPKQVIDNPWETIHPEDLEDYTTDWHRSLHTGQQFQHKIRLRRFDDNYRWYYVRAAPLRDKLQNIVHWVGTMIDLHDQHLAELNAARQQETAASEAKYRALANSSPQIVFAATRTKGVTFCNSQWLGYSGQTEEQAKGTGFMEHVYPDDLIKCQLPFYDATGKASTKAPLSSTPKPHRTESGTSSGSSSASNDTEITATMNTATSGSSQRKLSELATSGILRMSKDSMGKPSYSTEVRLRMQSGEYRWHLVRVLLAEPLMQASGEEHTWYGTCTDINDHKELEQTLKETMDAKSRFLSNMSHEIRTPLNGISGMANFLIDSNLTPEQMDQVNVIRASTEGLRDLINDILDLSKVEAGMITLNMDWLHIRSVIEEVNDLTSSLVTDKGIELNYLVEDTVPSMVKGDKFRIRQVLLNVIGNAIKFTQEGEVFVHCTVASDVTADVSDSSVLLQVDVIDTGRGFSEKEAERLFKRFSQIDGSSTRQHGGTGLGLVISMQLVELHGGNMSAKSIPGKGSTFTFTLKFGLPTATDHPPHVPKGPEGRIDKNAVTEPEQPRKAGMGITASPSSEQKENPETMGDVSTSPTFYTGVVQPAQPSPSVFSSASSVHSAPPASLSSQSSRSSQSSYSVDPGTAVTLGPSSDKHIRSADPVVAQIQERITLQARAYSILVVCPLMWTKRATVGHLNSVLNHTIPHLVTSRDNISEAREMIGGPTALTFSHIILVLQDPELSSEMTKYALQSTSSSTSVVIISDMATKRRIISMNPQLDFDQLTQNRRVQFIQKPMKPSRLAVIFDPDKSRELSTDQNQQSAQQIALSQKRVFDEMTRRIGNKNIKVLLVEDNKINQMVMLKLLRRVSVDVETCFDGVQATDKVLSNPVEYFSIILLDLMMPNKDGYETCRDIRAWEKKNNYPNIPIVALSANVLDDVWQKCKEAGFNSYLTKPVEFKELSDVMTAYLDPDDPSTPMKFMSR